MAALIVGLVLVLATHSMKSFAPALRGALMARLGKGPYMGLVSLVSVLGLVLIVWGFDRAWEAPVFLYDPPVWGRHVAMTLMAPALILGFASAFPAHWIRRRVGHPLLIGTVLWAVGHLFANGDLAGVVLFAAFLAWAVADRILQPATPATAAIVAPPGMWDIAAILAGLVLYALLLAGLHFWLFGVSPLG